MPNRPKAAMASSMISMALIPSLLGQSRATVGIHSSRWFKTLALHSEIPVAAVGWTSDSHLVEIENTAPGIIKVVSSSQPVDFPVSDLSYLDVQISIVWRFLIYQEFCTAACMHTYDYQDHPLFIPDYAALGRSAPRVTSSRMTPFFMQPLTLVDSRRNPAFCSTL